MKKSTLALLCLVLSFSILAQRSKSKDGSNLSLKHSEVSKEKGLAAGIRNQIIGVDTEYDETYTLMQRGFRLYFIPMGFKLEYSKYNARFQKIGSGKVKFKGLGSRRQYLGSELFGESIACFTTYQSTPRSKKLILNKIDKDNFTAGKDIRLISTSSEKGDRGTSFNYLISDNQKRLCAYTATYNKRNQSEKYDMIMLDEEYNVLWKKKHDVIHSLKYFNQIDSYVTNDGKLIIYGYEYETEKKLFNAKTIDGKQHLLVIDEDGVEDFELDLEDKFVSDMLLMQQEDGTINVAGYYGDGQNRRSGVEGAFWATLDIRSGDFKDIQYEKFEDDFIKQTWSDRTKKIEEKKKKFNAKRKRQLKEKEPQLYDYIIRDLIPTKDGGDLMVAEQYYMYVTTSRDSKGNVTYTYHYVYKDIIVIKRDKDHNVVWKSLIDKYQHTTNDNGIASSYTLLMNEDNNSVHFIFNDNLGNFDKSIRRGRSKKTESAVGMSLHPKFYAIADYEIDLENGEGKRKKLLDAGDLEKKMSIIPRQSMVLDNNRKVVLKATRKKKVQTITVTPKS